MLLVTRVNCQIPSIVIIPFLWQTTSLYIFSFFANSSVMYWFLPLTFHVLNIQSLNSLCPLPYSILSPETSVPQALSHLSSESSLKSTLSFSCPGGPVSKPGVRGAKWLSGQTMMVKITLYTYVTFLILALGIVYWAAASNGSIWQVGLRYKSLSLNPDTINQWFLLAVAHVFV